MEKSAGVVIIYQNKVLLVHPSSSKRYFGNYSFPKGHIEEGEKPLDAALREVYEEVGIKLKSSQLDKKMYEIPYIAKKNKKDIPKGSIYKTVYYWTCHINDLKEIRLTSEVVPKSQLQQSEVDWAGFVPANEIERRIAPVMSSIIKHINMNVNETKDKHNVLNAIEKDINRGNIQKFQISDDEVYYWASKLKIKLSDNDVDWVLGMLNESDKNYKVKGLSQFITERRKYLKKSDINWEKREPYILKDLKYMIGHALPYQWDEFEKHIVSIDDKSVEDKGIKFEVKLKNRDVITAYKTTEFAGDWEFYLNGKKAGRRGTRDELSKLFYDKLTDLEKYLKGIKSYDFNYLYADDFRAYQSGSNSTDNLYDLYSRLSNSEKRIAHKEFLKHAPKDKRVPFNEFSGL
jgi:8-oxo-dGTP pyrophosphatase MutT (NUDIX family)